MAVNENGHLVDDAGNVVIDHVWGNMPMQPNDQRTTDLNVALDNHINAVSGWNGYPLFVPNTPGEDVAGPVDYVLVASVLGLTTSVATKRLADATLVVTAATAATNAAIVVTAAARTALSTNLVFTAAGAGAAYPVGTKVVVSAFAGDDAVLNGTYTVTATATNSFTVVTTATTAVALTAQTASVVGLAGTIKVQSIAAGANSIAPATAITITPYAVAS